MTASYWFYEIEKSQRDRTSIERQKDFRFVTTAWFSCVIVARVTLQSEDGRISLSASQSGLAFMISRDRGVAAHCERDHSRFQ
jgi:hypothetical protein